MNKEVFISVARRFWVFFTLVLNVHSALLVVYRPLSLEADAYTHTHSRTTEANAMQCCQVLRDLCYLGFNEKILSALACLVAGWLACSTAICHLPHLKPQKATNDNVL